MADILVVPLACGEPRLAERIIKPDGDQAPSPITLSSPSKAPRVSAGLSVFLPRCWAIFITTSRGRNHAKTMHDMARVTPGWHARIR
jgi:hypothetical protein